MRLSFHEIRQRAIQFGHDWKDETSERAESQTFWNEFFNVFGINRRSVASFERTVRNLEGAYDRIDVIWQGVLIGEHKSKGHDLAKASTQAFGYVQSLTHAGRDSEIPRFIAVSDFAQIVLHDLESTDPLLQSVSFPVEDLHQHIRLFDFLNGIQSRPAEPEDPINIKAVEVLGELHDTLEKGGYSGHPLERLLVRVLFCLFADDTGIFQPDAFKSLIEETREDGSDLGPQLHALFKALDQPDDKRSAKMPETLRQLPYVNGQLFKEDLDLAYFDADMRKALLKASGFQWAKISPAVFGSLFQSIMADDAGAKRRRQIGAHYTSERDILKLIRSLFLDDLRAEFAKVKSKRNELAKFHEKLGSLKFLDPACGCGNFLVVGYRELRRLEHEVIETLFPDHGLLEIAAAVKLDVDCMHGIEIEEWPARIAEVAMWLIDHQMNLEASRKFGKPLLRLPLRKSARIENANALRIDWNDVLPAAECSFVMGNPPFVGAKYQNESQRADLATVAGDVPDSGLLDYVTLWYFRAISFCRDTQIRCAFVSTNSICQGEQAGVLWEALFQKGVHIHFGHRTFTWQSEARGKAHVHVVIVGFGMFEASRKLIYDYSTDPDVPQVFPVTKINGYLTNGLIVAIKNRSKPLCQVPEIGIGNKPIDDGNFLFTDDEKQAFIQTTPASRPLFRKWVGSHEFINGYHRWCLWLGDASPSDLRSMPEVMRRIENVRRFRLASKSAPTRKLAEVPTRFHVENMPKRAYLIIPGVSSERRPFIPIGFMPPSVIASNLVNILPDATLFHFGILTSTMHMAWVRQVCGRLKSDFRYSNKLVYNNYPWPQEASEKQRAAVEAAAQAVLDAREQFPDQTLADLYDPLTMPKLLRDAHKKLDATVDKCYRRAPFASERNRVEYLFDLYQRLVSPLTITTKKSRKSN
jgi:hypothetical protein